MADGSGPSGPKFAIDRGFFHSLEDLGTTDESRVMTAVNRFIDNPAHPSLRLEQLRAVKLTHGATVWSIRASDEIRVLLEQLESQWIFLRAGHHDALYRYAERLKGRNPSTGEMVSVIGEPSSVVALPSERPPSNDAPTAVEGSGVGRGPVSTGAASDHFRSQRPKPFDHWTDENLIELARFTESQVAELRQCRTEEEVLELIDYGDWDDRWIDYALDVCTHTPAEWKQARLLGPSDVARLVVQSLEKNAYYSGFIGPMDAEEAKKLVSSPIEDWMVYLHPEQEGIVKAVWEGPVRVRGPAGTGKTVVALHRAAELAKRYGKTWSPSHGSKIEPPGPPVLFTTFVRSLVNKLRELYGRLPKGGPNLVEFRTVDSLAYYICRCAGETSVIANENELKHTFSLAWREVVSAGSPIDRSGLTREYVREEIDTVIKGKALASLEDYLQVTRTGRLVPLRAEVREQIWELKARWEAELRDLGLQTFGDRVLRALEIVEGSTTPLYRSVVVDEAQDLTLAQLRLLTSIVPALDHPEWPDTFMLVGDGAQRIYPGGYTLAEAGISVRGRSRVLRVCYRSTRQNLAAARAICDDYVEDLEESFKRGEDPVETAPAGSKPQLIRFSDEKAEADWIVATITELEGEEEFSLGDIAVLAATNEATRRWKNLLGSSGIACRDLAELARDSNGNNKAPGDESVWVGTFHRAKGLEFKAVFVPGMSSGGFPPNFRWRSPEEQEEDERRYLSQLYVAMTRARDFLAVSSVGQAFENVEKVAAEGLIEAVDYTS